MANDPLVVAKRHLIEANSPGIMQDLQNKGIKVIGLTSHPTGKFGHLSNVEKWKINSIQSFNFHFERSFPSIPNQTIKLPMKQDYPLPIYEDGILFCRGYKKGEALLGFLQIAFQPKKVVFIDDLIKNLETVDEALKPSGIEFKGYHYTKAHLNPEQIDTKIVSFQFDCLMNEGKWISDDQAQASLDKFSNGLHEKNNK